MSVRSAGSQGMQSGKGSRARRVLGIDTSLRSTGLGVVESRGSTMRAVEFTTIKNRRDVSLSACLCEIAAGISLALDRTAPDAAAIEDIFYCKNARTSMILGHARGVAIAECARRDIPVYQYAPRRVKQAVVGYGGAGKEQVKKMVMTLLGLREKLSDDESDALAIAVCHVHNSSGLKALEPESI